MDGLKTGHTNTAGYNLIASSKRNGRRVVSVVVGTESIEARASESSKLLNWALQAFDTPKAYDANIPISSVKVYKGQEDNVNNRFPRTRLPHHPRTARATKSNRFWKPCSPFWHRLKKDRC